MTSVSSLNKFTYIRTRPNPGTKSGPKGSVTAENENPSISVRPPTNSVRPALVPLPQVTRKPEVLKEVPGNKKNNPKQGLKRQHPPETRLQKKTKKRRSDVMELEANEPVTNHSEEEDWSDIDEEDRDDPQAVIEYVEDIYHHLRQKEREDQIDARYMERQLDVNEKMRAVLVDWLVEVHRTFKLLPETLFLTVHILDSFLERSPVSRDRLQLVGVTAMLIAAKYQEIYAPEVGDFVFISDGTYSKEQVLDCEEEILAVMEYKLTTPSSLDFLRRFSKASAADTVGHSLGKYLLEISLMDLKMYRYCPSEIAAAAVYIARTMTSQNPVWTSTLQHYTTYTEAEARGVALDLHNLLKRMTKYTSCQSIRTKYSSPKLAEVAKIPLVVDL